MNRVQTLKRIILVTGPPGIGKTSVIRRAVKELKNKKHKIGGVICHEVREGGIRVGFEIMDLSTETRGWLAHVNQTTGPKVGKYHVNLTDLDVTGANAIHVAIKNADIIAVDEIGTMELMSTAFSNALLKAMQSNKPIIGTIHFKISNSIVDSIKQREDIEIITVTYENRENLHKRIIKMINECLNENETKKTMNM